MQHVPFSRGSLARNISGVESSSKTPQQILSVGPSPLKSDPEMVKFYQRFIQSQERLGRVVPINNVVSEKLAGILGEVLSALGYNQTDYTLRVLRSSDENAFVFPGVAPAPIFVTTALLAALAERYEKVTKGHAALILGHEAAHVREEAYEPPKTLDPVESASEFVELLRTKYEMEMATAAALLEGRAGGRAEEYECDRRGIQAARRLGATDAEPIEVLKFLAELEAKAKTTKRSRSKFVGYVTLMKKVLATHPASRRRVNRGAGYQRMLTLRGEPEFPSASRVELGIDAAVKELQALTPMELRLHGLTEALRAEKQLRRCASKIKSAIDQAESVVELQHIAVVAALQLRALKKDTNLPLIGEIPEVEENSKADETRDNIDRTSADFIDSIMLDLRAKASIICSNADVVAVLSTVCAGIIHYLGLYVDSSNMQCLGEDPLEMYRTLQEYGVVDVDRDNFSSAWRSEILSGPAVDSAEAIFYGGRIDYRLELASEWIFNNQRLAARLLSYESLTRLVADLNSVNPGIVDPDTKDFEVIADFISGKARQLLQGVIYNAAEFSKLSDSLQSMRDAPHLVVACLAPIAASSAVHRDPELRRAVIYGGYVPENLRFVLARCLLLQEFRRDLQTIEPSHTQLLIEVGRACRAHKSSIQPRWSIVSNYDEQLTRVSEINAKLPDYYRGFGREIYRFAAMVGDYKTGNYQPARRWTNHWFRELGESVYGKDILRAAAKLKEDDELVSWFRGIDQGVMGGRLSVFLSGESRYIEDCTAQLRGVFDSAAVPSLVATFGMFEGCCFLAEAFFMLSGDRADEIKKIPDEYFRRFLERESVRALPKDIQKNLHEAAAVILPALTMARKFVLGGKRDVKSDLDASGDTSRNVENTLKLYEEYDRFLSLRLSPKSVRDKDQNRAEMPDSLSLSNIAFKVGRSLFDLTYVYGLKDEAERYQQMSPDEQFAIIDAHFIAKSPERDRHLRDILERAPAGEAGILLKSKIFSALQSHVHAAKLSREIYDLSVAAQGAQQPLQTRVELITKYLLPGSSRREEEIVALYDGGVRYQALVRSFADHKFVKDALSLDADKTERHRMLRGSGLEIILDTVEDDRVSPAERARVLLWIAGLRESSILVECAELATGRRVKDLKKESDLLTKEEKEQILIEALSGPQGVLRDTGPGRQLFIDTLFIGVFKNLASDTKTLREAKACFDTMMRFDEPERAARFLASCMVGYLEKLSEPEQVKLLFSSYGAIGPKAAQQVIARTDLFSAETREALMDLTSRVPGGSCAELYDAFEAKYGPDAQEFIYTIEPAGGGSFQQVWYVTLWNQDRTGPGKKLACCKLREEVVINLREDLRTTQGLADAMEAVPERFGGAHLNRRAGRVIAMQSALETSYGFITKQQEQAQIECRSRSFNGVAVTVPEIVRSHTFRRSDGTIGSVSLSDLEFIFMECAAGETLDHYLQRFPEDKAKIYSTLGRYAVTSILRGATVHCDLHHGNIFVAKTEDGSLQISLIDWGISVKPPAIIVEGLQHLVRVAVGASDDGASFKGVFQKLTGTGKVSEKKGSKFMTDFLTALCAAVE